MKKKGFAILLCCFVLLSLTGCGSSYEDDLNNGINKWKTGNGDSMSDSERNAVNDFWEWQSKQ